MKLVAVRYMPRKKGLVCDSVFKRQNKSQKRKVIVSIILYTCVVIHQLKDGIVVKLREIRILLIFLSP